MPEEIQQYKKMGGKTLFSLIFKRCGVIFLPIVLLALIITASFFIPANYVSYIDLAMVVVWIVLIITVFFVLFIGWLEYLRYQITIDQESIKINRGIISETQTGIPFRRIREAVIERGIFDQIIGTSSLTFTVSDDDGNGDNHSQESKILMPALDKNVAIAIQDLVLEKAQVEEMNIRQGMIAKQS
jgi:uncharacterized membrane protein YdbT with pleckstrin-like domain